VKRKKERSVFSSSHKTANSTVSTGSDDPTFKKRWLSASTVLWSRGSWFRWKRNSVFASVHSFAWIYIFILLSVILTIIQLTHQPEPTLLLFMQVVQQVHDCSLSLSVPVPLMETARHIEDIFTKLVNASG